MTKYKLIDVVTDNNKDYLRLKDINKTLSPSILVEPEKCLVVPDKDNYVFVLKKDMNLRKRLKDMAINIALGLLVVVFILWLLSAWLFTEPDGHYKYKDGNADGTGINYEWIQNR